MKPLKFDSPTLIKPHERVRLAKLPTELKGGPKNETAAGQLVAKHCVKLDKLQEVFYASQECGLLIVLQGMDTAGKDGTIRHIFSGINPQGCDVTPFKTPTPLEARHDFLWRAHAAVPPRGMIGIFNRSHYEDLLYPRVHGQISGKTVRERIEDINEFESALWDNNVVILKFFLHISHEEQTRRLQARIDNPDKHWKFSAADFAERKLWPQYCRTPTTTCSPPPAANMLPGLLSHPTTSGSATSSSPTSWSRPCRGSKLKYPAPTMDPASIQL